jgi:hypothetical protein
LLEAIRIRKNSLSLVCGDDLEIGPPWNEEIIALARKNIDKDTAIYNGLLFHPGILLALYEVFGEQIQVNSGVWWNWQE